jgi:hypothetical protein
LDRQQPRACRQGPYQWFQAAQSGGEGGQGGFGLGLSGIVAQKQSIPVLVPMAAFQRTHLSEQSVPLCESGEARVAVHGQELDGEARLVLDQRD